MVKKLFEVVQICCGVHPTFYPMGTGGSFLGVKRPGREADHSPPASAGVKKCGSIHPLPHTPSWGSAYFVKYRDNFTFLPLPSFFFVCCKSVGRF
jgi:hypothetical protein